MEVVGYACPQTNVEPNVVYTPNDRRQLPNHLAQPFMYIQKLFPRGRTPNETAIDHPSYFQYFQTYNPSTNVEFSKLLKAMSKGEREQFYHKSIVKDNKKLTMIEQEQNLLHDI